MVDETKDAVVPGRSGKQLRPVFDAWAAPVEQDFQDLIALADIGRQAIGLNEQTFEATGLRAHGLETMPVSGRLRLALIDASGLDHRSSEGLQIIPGAGLGTQRNGTEYLLSVADGGGVSCDAQTGCVGLQVRAPLSASGSSMSVERGLGMAPGSELGLHVGPSDFVLDASGLSVRCAPHGGLVVDETGQLTLDFEFLMGI